jgi:hypothetical protein
MEKLIYILFVLSVISSAVTYKIYIDKATDKYVNKLDDIWLSYGILALFQKGKDIDPEYKRYFNVHRLSFILSFLMFLAIIFVVFE